MSQVPPPGVSEYLDNSRADQAAAIATGTGWMRGLTEKRVHVISCDLKHNFYLSEFSYIKTEDV
jgi:hypothetical protein